MEKPHTDDEMKVYMLEQVRKCLENPNLTFRVETSENGRFFRIFVINKNGEAPIYGDGPSAGYFLDDGDTLTIIEIRKLIGDRLVTG